MTHDPVCPRWMTTMNGDTWHPFENSGTCLLCDLIAKVRADEREKVLTEGPYFTTVVHDCCMELQDIKAARGEAS